MNIQPAPMIQRHPDATMWVNDLILDLKLTLAGHEPVRPITTSRLEEWEKYWYDLSACRESIEVKYGHLR